MMTQPSPRPSRAGRPRTLPLSVVLPVHDEEASLWPLHGRLVAALEGAGLGFEAIYVDDGSRDGSFAELERIASKDPRARVVQLRRNYGQTAALTAGIDHARGEVLVFLDADLQNDPADIPRLVAALDGHDVVSGWRRTRHDSPVRVLPSRVANRLISAATGVRLHDWGCTLKAYRADVLDQFRLYGEMHRFIPAYLAQVGARVGEIEVAHAPRAHGRSKYGLERTVKVLLDLLTVQFIGRYGTKPIYVFGGVGLACLAGAALAGAAMVWQKLALGVSMIQTPLLLLAAILGVMGFQSILMGLMSELIMRTYYESQDKPAYLVRRVLNG